MDLRNYLKKHKIKKRDFAFTVDMNEVTLNNYTYHKITPSVLSAMKILHATNYEVEINTMLSRSDEDNFQRWKKGFELSKKMKLEKFIEESEEILDNYIPPEVLTIEKSYVSREKYEELQKIVEAYQQADENAKEEMKKFTMGFAYGREKREKDQSTLLKEAVHDWIDDK